MDASLTNFTPALDNWSNPVASPINLALRDLKRDWLKTVGITPTVLGSVPTGAWDGGCILVFALAPAGTMKKKKIIQHKK